MRGFGSPSSPPEEENNGNESGKLKKDRYLILIFSFVSCSIFAYYLLDYVFYDQVEGRFTDEQKVAGFLGIYSAILGIVNLFTNAFVPGRLITRYGLGASLLAVPVIVGIGSGSAAISALPMVGATIFFWMIVGTKLLDEVGRSSVGDPSLRILYQPISIAHEQYLQRIPAKEIP